MKDKRSLIIFVALILSFATLNATEPKINECAGMTRDECTKMWKEKYKAEFDKSRELKKKFKDYTNMLERTESKDENYRRIKQAIDNYPEMADILTDMERILLSMNEDELFFSGVTGCLFDNGGLVSNEYKHLKHLYEEQK